MEGYIHRLADGILGWTKEYAVVKDGEFRYYKDKGKKLKGIFLLNNSKVEMVTEDPLRIVIQLADNKTVQLKCNNITDKVNWVNTLCMVDQSSDSDDQQKEEVLVAAENLKEIQNELATLFQAKMLKNTSKLNAYVTQAWTFQGLLEATLSDFSMDLEKVKSPTDTLKENAENIKRYTTELKVILNIRK